MNQFAFAGADVTKPDGTVLNDVVAISRPDQRVLIYNEDGIEHRIAMASGWAEGQRGYGFTDVDGGTWLVKRTKTGCGGCGP